MHKIITREGKGIGQPVDEKVEDVTGDTKIVRDLPDGKYIIVTATYASLNKPDMSTMGRVARPRHNVDLNCGESEVVFDNGCLASLVGRRRQVIISKP